MTSLPEVAQDVADVVIGIPAAFDISAQDGLNCLSHARGYLDELEVKMIAAMRAKGWTWDEIANEYGITRQAAHARFADRV